MELSQLWHNIYQEAVQLADSVERLPDACECGDADAHLEGRCHCCNSNRDARGQQVAGENCNSLLARLRADLTMLSQDISLAGPPVEAFAHDRQQLELRRGVFLAANDLQELVETFKRVTESVAGFRRDCAVSRMRAIRRHCAELRDHCERVDAELLNWQKQAEAANAPSTPGEVPTAQEAL